MLSKGEIESTKILIKDVFKMWFTIPSYQRPYVWGDDEIYYLLDDLMFALKEKPEAEYFLGSFVVQRKPAAPERGQKFSENDLLDGQQRMATLLFLMAVIRDLENSQEIKHKCQEYIYQKPDTIENIPERVRIIFLIRPEVERFINEYVKTEGGTNKEEELKKIRNSSPDISVRNMANAILKIREIFRNNENDINLIKLLAFLANKVLMIYVATEELEDAFRLFMILNDRGIPLRNSDILKSINIGALEREEDKKYYAKFWESAEGDLGDDFDRFLNHIRTILVKERPRLTLLKEFENKIYNPKEIDRATQQKKKVLLQKGEETFLFIEKYLNYYKTLLGGKNNYDETGDFKFDNLIRIMWEGLPATDWIPPLLAYFDKFGYSEILKFLEKLDNKFSADLMGQIPPTYRIENMNDVIKVIEVTENIQDLLSSKCFDFDSNALFNVIEGSIYGKRFTKYILLKLDYLFHNHDQKMHFETLSVEHILPQSPDVNSQWMKDFTLEQREEWTHKLGNIVLITRRKNSEQGRMDYCEKVKKYFKNNIDTCPNSIRILNKYSKWTINEMQENHCELINIIRKHYTK